MRYRKLMVTDAEYWYYVGKSHVEIRRRSITLQPGITLQKWVPTIWNLKGISVEAFERGRRKRTQDGAVTPSEIVAYLTSLGIKSPCP